MADLSQVSTEDLMAYRAGRYGDMTTEGLMAVRGLKPAMQKGFLDRVGDRVSAMQKREQDIDNAQERGEQGSVHSFFQKAGEEAILLNNIAGEAISSITPEPVKEAAKSVLNTVGNYPPVRAATDSAVALAKPAMEKYNAFAKEHPVIARDIRATVGFGGLVGGTGVAKGTISAVPALAEKGTSLVKSTGNALVTKVKKPSISGFKDETAALMEKSRSGYKAQRAENIQFADEDIVGLRKSLSKIRPKKDLDIRDWADGGELKQVDDILDSINTEAPDFNSLLNKRNTLNSKINVAERAGDNAKASKLKEIKKAIDDVMINEKTGAWQVANHQFSQAAALDDIDYIVQKAEGRAQPANSLDTAINNYLLSPESKSLKDAERKALEAVTKVSKKDTVRKAVASGLTKYTTAAIGAKGGPAGAFAGYLVGHYGAEFAKDAAMLAKLEKLEEFRNLVLSRPAPEIPQAKPTLQLGYRGDAARAAEKRAQTMERLKEGRTGGAPIEKRSGPYVGRDVGDVPYNYYGADGDVTYLLPSPEKMPRVPMQESEIAAARAANNRPYQEPNPAIRPPVSQKTKLKDRMAQRRQKEFQDLIQIYRDGDMSANQFVKDSMKKYGLTRQQARDLAREVKVYGD